MYARQSLYNHLIFNCSLRQKKKKAQSVNHTSSIGAFRNVEVVKSTRSSSGRTGPNRLRKSDWRHLWSRRNVWPEPIRDRSPEFKSLRHHNGFGPHLRENQQQQWDGNALAQRATENPAHVCKNTEPRWSEGSGKMSERNGEGRSCRGEWRVWLWQRSPGGLWDGLSEAIPSRGGLIRFITSQISGGACCQTHLSARPVIRASNEDGASWRPVAAQMTPRPGSVEEVWSSTQTRLITTHYVHRTTFSTVVLAPYVSADC